MGELITETLVKKLPCPPNGNRILYDSKLKGFGVRATSGGAKSFVLNYRSGGRERRITIGGYPEWSAAAARKEAVGLKRRIDLGEDPLARRNEDRAAATVSELCALYEERHLPKKRPSSQRDDRSIIERVVKPRFGRVKVAALRFIDVEAMHRDLSQTAPYAANRAVALISKMYSLAIKWGLATDNPAKGIDRNVEQPRARYLDLGELERLFAVLDKHPNVMAANAVRLLLLTGARRGEVLSATWDQFNLETGVWVKPAATVKQARLHRVPLSGAAVDLLRDMRAANLTSQFLFPSSRSDAPLADIKKAWASIGKLAGLTGVRLHDLRHSFASHIVSAGNSLPIVGALLGHTQAQTTQRYAHLLDQPLRSATEQFGKSIQGRRTK